MEEWGTIITTITTILPFPTNQKARKRRDDGVLGYGIMDFWFRVWGLGFGKAYLWLVGNGGMGYNYNYYYYHSSIPY